MSKTLMIGDLAAATGTKVNTIRFYEETGLMRRRPNSIGSSNVRCRGPEAAEIHPPGPQARVRDEGDPLAARAKRSAGGTVRGSHRHRAGPPDGHRDENIAADPVA